MKMKVILTKGLPASGKTTWAKKLCKSNKTFKRINKDDLRAMVDDKVFSKENEKLIIKLRDNMVLNFLKEGYNVIIDDTNLHHKHLQNITKLVKGIAEVEVNDSFLSVSVEECIRRDLVRENPVGEKVIYSMAKQIEGYSKKDKKTHWEKTLIKEGMLIAKPRVFNKDLPNCIIVDMDGTLSMMNGRSPYEFKRCIEDLPNYPIINIVKNYRGNNLSNKIFIVSGRENIAYEETKQWLEKYNIPFDNIFMREKDDYRSDVIVKKEIYDRAFLNQYNIHFVLDDREKVVKMWRENDLTCLQVAEGNF